MHTKPRSDAELVSASVEGDQNAFEGLVNRYQNVVFSLARQRTTDLAQAEDVTQEVFLRAYRDLRKLRSPQKWGKWLYGIALNVTREQARIRRPEVSLESIVEPKAAPEQRVHRQLLSLIGTLPDKYRLPLTLHYVDTIPYAQIGRMLGIRESSARSRVCRAKAMLRKKAGIQ